MRRPTSPSLDSSVPSAAGDAATLQVRSEFEIADGPVRAAGATWLAAEGDPLLIYDIDSGAVVAELEIESVNLPG